MKKTTNIKEIKKVAILFLHYPLNLSNFTAFAIIQHPFFQNQFIFDIEKKEMIDILESDKNLSRAKKFYVDIINNSKNINEIMMMLVVPYRAVFFDYIQKFLSEEDYGQQVRDIWILTEYPNKDVNVSVSKFKKMFKNTKKDCLMETDEINFLNDLDEQIVIYRGSQKPYYNALSWTIDKNVAIKFMKMRSNNSTVYKGLINKKDILAYFDTDEKEVIVDYSKIMNIVEI